MTKSRDPIRRLAYAMDRHWLASNLIALAILAALFFAVGGWTI